MLSDLFNNNPNIVFLGVLALLGVILLVALIVKNLRKGKSKLAEDNTQVEEKTAHETGVAEAEPQQRDETATTLGDSDQDRRLTSETAKVIADEAAARVVAEPQTKVSVLQRVKQGLAKTRSNLTDGIAGLFAGGKAPDEEVIEEIESILLMADVGMDATQHIVERLTQRLSRRELADSEALRLALKDELLSLLKPCAQPLQVTKSHLPFVVLMVGVNGAGKTTTIGKLAKYFQAQGQSVMLAAGDTFRAAAVEQLQEWGHRNQVPVVAQHTGADSASVIFDALQSAQAKKVDVLIADTAGRLQNKDHLMEELSKVKRVMAKLDAQAPHEVMLVLDAGTGQNALSQAALFNQAVGVTGISMTKLDGTAKGGVIFAVAKQMGLPIRFIGVGEKIDDLKVFDAQQFVDALLD